MAAVPPPILKAVRLAYRDVTAAVQAMPRLMVVAGLITVVFDVGEAFLWPKGSESARSVLLATFVLGLVQTLLATPLLIGVHRFIVLGETTPGYVLDLRAYRVEAYVLFWAALSTAAMVPTFLLSERSTEAALVGWVFLVVVMVAGLRLSLLFPAIAVDAPGATWPRALADSRGHGWRIFLTGLGALLPFASVGTLLHQVVGQAAPWSFAATVLTLVDTVIGLISLILFAAVSSRLYQWIGTTLARPD
jgi:hypothetical protein